MRLKDLTLRNLILTIESLFDSRVNWVHDEYIITQGEIRGDGDKTELDLKLWFIGGYQLVLTIEFEGKLTDDKIPKWVYDNREKLADFGFIDDLELPDEMKLPHQRSRK